MRYILSLLLFFNLLGVATSVQGQTNADPELAALQGIYDLTNGGNWVYYKWNKQHLDEANSPADLLPAEFPGLQIINGHIIKITLPNNANIRGTLPSAEVLNGLSFLTEFSIPGNDASTIYYNMIGGALPDLSGISSLKKINFSYNQFTGSINWSTLLNLTFLNLSGTGNAPTPMTFDIGSVNFSNWNTLVSLDLSFVQLSGTFHSSIGLLDQLTDLKLIHCGLTGSPSSSNSFSLEFGQMSNLQTLDLTSNPIINLPACIGSLLTLNNCILDNCSLQTLPNEFAQLDNLTELHLGNNSLGNYPSNFFNMIGILTGCAKLTYLHVPSNSLLDVPSNFNQLLPLRYLNFNSNPVASSQMANLADSKITSLDCVECHLTNQLPSTWFQGSMTLTALNLSNHYASTSNDRNFLDFNSAGVSQVLLNMDKLVSFTAIYDAIAPGVLPSWLGTSNTNQWTTLSLQHNKIQLPLPATMGQMTKLVYLNLSNNSLNGVFASTATPANAFSFTGFTSLSSLYLNNNQLTSPLPNFANCTALQYLDLYNNQFTGDVPVYFLSGVTLLYSLNISNNGFTGIPNLTSRSNKSSFQLNVGNNYFDFEDLEPFFVGPSMYQLNSFNWTPQKTTNIGLPKTYYVVEGSSNFPIDYSVGSSSHNTYFWQHYNGNGWVNASTSYSPGPYTISSVTTSSVGPYRTLIQNEWVTGLMFYGNTVQVNLIPPLCQTPIAQKTGKFKMDKLTGAIVYDRDDCSANIPVICIYGPANGLNDVVTAKAVIYSDDWSYSYLGNNSATTNPFKTGEKGKWRAQASYAADAPLIQSNDKNYNAGTFKYMPFNWKSGERSAYPGWLLSSKVEKYSPDGAAVEERNAIGIPSTAKFGYSGSLPYLVAQNAEYNSVLFESFENNYGSVFEDGFSATVGTHDKLVAHSGSASLKLSGPTTVTVKTLNLNDQIKNNGILARVWLKGVLTTAPSLRIEGAATATIATHLISRSGEWAMYEAVTNPAMFSSSALNTSLSVKLLHTEAETIWMDDVRIQPTNSELTAYVYDRSSLKLLTVFDDQHFGLFYQYNAEGKLIRKIIETEKGRKTIMETQYNTPLVSKPN